MDSDGEGPPPLEPDPVLSAAAVTKLYVIAALDDAVLHLLTVRARLLADLSGPAPFAVLLAADEQLRGLPVERRTSGEYSAAMRDACQHRRRR